MCAISEEQSAREILSYLAEHEEAQDTVEGIVEWWLLEQRIKQQTVGVKRALAALVGTGLVLERKGRDARLHYRINRHRMQEIRALLSQAS
ncbi:MAG TPA: hypothetical protein VG148_10395 [Pyrinomonadaceae bacterium]|nr:hypothetical protein [Pyrinomonadaceae bacterium]